MPKTSHIWPVDAWQGARAWDAEGKGSVQAFWQACLPAVQCPRQLHEACRATVAGSRPRHRDMCKCMVIS